MRVSNWRALRKTESWLWYRRRYKLGKNLNPWRKPCELSCWLGTVRFMELSQHFETGRKWLSTVHYIGSQFGHSLVMHSSDEVSKTSFPFSSSPTTLTNVPLSPYISVTDELLRAVVKTNKASYILWCSFLSVRHKLVIHPSKLKRWSYIAANKKETHLAAMMAKWVNL